MQTTTNVIDKNWKALIKPNKLEITSNDDRTIAKVTAEPLEKGFGQTIGNSLRRILMYFEITNADSIIGRLYCLTKLERFSWRKSSFSSIEAAGDGISPSLSMYQPKVR